MHERRVAIDQRERTVEPLLLARCSAHLAKNSLRRSWLYCPRSSDGSLCVGFDPQLLAGLLLDVGQRLVGFSDGVGAEEAGFVDDLRLGRHRGR